MVKSIAVIMDYENVLRMGRKIFQPHAPMRECLIDPYRYGTQIAQVKNAQKESGETEDVKLARIEVYRGLPDPRDNPRGYRANELQKQIWTTGHDGCVNVTLRPLKLEKETGTWREKGVDVLCALALVRAARSGDYDVVILASRDTDLAPALDEANSLKAERTKVEAVKWYDPAVKFTNGQIKTDFRLWTIGMRKSEYKASLDTTDYR